MQADSLPTELPGKPQFPLRGHHLLLLRSDLLVLWGFPDSSVGKESACNAEDPSSISRSGRSSGEGIGYPLQYFWASLVAQLVKNPPVMLETCVRFLGWEDPLEKGKATDSSILAKFHGLYIAWGRKESDTTDFTSLPGSCSHLACCSLQPCPG